MPHFTQAKEASLSMQPTDHCYIHIANKYAGEPCKIYTLDGIKDAVVAGRLNRFATIMLLTGGVGIEVNWPTVERKMEGDKTFYAC